MKKILPLLFLGISLASCSKKGDDPAPMPIVKPTIVGSWIGTSVEMVSTNAGVSTTRTETLGIKDYILNFTINNQLIETFGKRLAPPSGGIRNGMYTYSNGIIVATITSPDSTTTTYKVESLTNDVLVLSYKETIGVSGRIDYYTVTLTR
jgi:hypothetical protein